MTLFPNDPFYDGQRVYSEMLTAIANPVFDDQTAYLGHLAKIADSSLSDAPTAIKARLVGYENAFKCVVSSGLVINVTGGFLVSDTNSYTVANTTVTAPNDTTSYIWLSATGVVNISTLPDVVSVVIAKVIASSGVITSLVDYRDLGSKRLQTNAKNTLVFGGQHSTDLTCTAGQTLSDGLYYCKNFNVPAGITANISQYAVIHCSGKANVAGTVNVSTFAFGANGIGSFQSSGYIPSRPGVGLGTYSGAVGWGCQGYGSGGQTGTFTNYGNLSIPSITMGKGGDGGGGLHIRAAKGIDVSGTINAPGQAASASSVGNTSGQSTTIQVAISGSAGGSGGVITLSSPSYVNITSSAALAVPGGAGGNATGSLTGNVYTGMAGGGGGSGGWIVILCPVGTYTNASTNINLSGGINGAAWNDYTASILSAPSGAGGASAGGLPKLYLAYPSFYGGSGIITQVPYLPLG